jgi:hypothetical protein
MAGGKKQQDDERAAKKIEVERGISRAIKELDSTSARVKLGQLSTKWQLADRDASFETQTIHMFRAFDLDYDDNMLEELDRDRGSFGLRELDERINERELEAIGLYHRMHELQMFPEKESEDPDLEKHDSLRKMIKVLEMVFYAKRVVLSAFQAKLAIHQLHVDEGVLDLDQDLDARLGSWALRFRFIDGDTTGFQNLLLYLLDAAMEKKYRKSNGWLYEPIVVDGQDMHSWQAVCEIKDFVYSLLRKETCWDQWKNATHNMKNVTSAIEYLTNCHDHQLPTLVRQRGVYSFPNGVYIAEDDHFHEFKSAAKPLSDSVVSCKFIEKPFEPRDAWRDVPTPYLDSIMAYQEWPPEVREWLYALLGRMLYPLNKFDSWQVIPFFKGLAATGKSTIVLKVCKNFFDTVDVGILSNNIERKFGISAFYDKYLIVAPEVRNDLAIEQAEFQSIVSGEDIQVNVKHKKAFSVEWSVPGALAGNEVPSWADSAGSIQRRIVLFEFAKPVRNGDMRLADKLNDELPNIIQKCNKAYLEKARMYSDANIWSVLPAYFANTRDSLAQATNSIEGFLASPDVRVGDDQWCPLDDFKSALKDYEIKNSIPSRRYSNDLFVGPFEKLGLKMCRDTRSYRGVERYRDYVVGVDINIHATENMLG